MLDNFSNTEEGNKNWGTFFGYATMGIIITRLEGEIEDINPFALKLFGYSQEDLIGKKIEILIPQGFYQKQNQYRQNLASNPEFAAFRDGVELFGVMKDGKEFPIEISFGLTSTHGSDSLISFISDISGRYEYEANLKKLHSELENTITKRTKDLQETMLKLKKSKTQLENALIFQKTLLDKAGAIIIATDEKGIINLFNNQAANMLGYDQQEILGKKSPLLFHSKKDIERKRKQLASDFEIEVENDFDVLVERARRNLHEEEEYDYIKKTGESFPVSLNVTALQNNEGLIIGFMAIAVDITERLRAERNLKKTEHLFLQLLQNYPDGIISIIDHNFNFVYTGGELHKKLHANVRMLIGKKAFPFFPESLRKIILPVLERIFQEKVFVTEFELPIPVVNGTYIMDAFPLMEEDGAVNYIGVIIKNISELKLIEKGLRKDLQIEKELNELKSRFVTMASHEFRTPLSTVLSSAYLIEKYMSAEDQPKRQKHVHRIVSSVNMLTNILNDFLNLGKIEEGKLRANFSEFNLREMIISTIDEIKNNLKKDQQIKYDHRGDPEVFLDLSLVKHIFMNLVSNASKFSPDSAVINIKTWQKNSHIVLSVKDEGIGISPEDQKHLINRFFRAANAQNIQGTGLGLHIVSKYAEMMNGELEFKSELGKGSEFKIAFKPQRNTDAYQN